MFNRKKKIITIVVALCLILGITGPFLAKNMYIHSIISLKKPVESYDGKFAFLKMPTEKWYVHNINIYDTEPAIFKQQIENFGHRYNKFYMEEIMWGNQNYDLFCLTSEMQYIFKYDEKAKRWFGPLNFDMNKTMEKRLQGIDDIYCYGPAQPMVGADYLPLTDDFCQVSKQEVPALIAEDNENLLRKYLNAQI